MLVPGVGVAATGGHHSKRRIRTIARGLWLRLGGNAWRRRRVDRQGLARIACRIECAVAGVGVADGVSGRGINEAGQIVAEGKVTGGVVDRGRLRIAINGHRNRLPVDFSLSYNLS